MAAAKEPPEKGDREIKTLWRRDFFGHGRIAYTLYHAVKPDPAALEFLSRVACPGDYRWRLSAASSIPRPPKAAARPELAPEVIGAVAAQDRQDVLDTGLPRAYDKPLYEQKCAAVFEHFFRELPGAQRRRLHHAGLIGLVAGKWTPACGGRRFLGADGAGSWSE